jgi:N utilization substance protein A
MLTKLFEQEVPEIYEGIVQIESAAREPGGRSKIAVASRDGDVDPVGACVGMKGSRVQNVVQELRGEKIDIIPWHIDAAKYVCNALAPAEISRVIIDETNRAMEVIVPDEFLSIAIGKRGQNVRLASRLTGWHLDVQSETKYNETMRSGYESIVALPGVGVSLADALYEKGFFSTEEISIASIEDLMQVRDMTAETAQELIDVARQAILDAEAENEIEEDGLDAVDAPTEEHPAEALDDGPDALADTAEAENQTEADEPRAVDAPTEEHPAEAHDDEPDVLADTAETENQIEAVTSETPRPGGDDVKQTGQE